MARVRGSGPALDRLEERLGITFKDRARLERALTHSSLVKSGSSSSYERLEFLGDRVLGLTIAEKLFQLFPQSDEGDLSLRLNALVSAETCAAVADDLGLPEFIRHGADLKRAAAGRNRNIRADVVEALIAAIYLDHGLEVARSFILTHWEERFGQVAEARRDPKTELQEWAHKQAGVPPVYEQIERSGPDHEPVFTVRASVPNYEPAEGRGRSKRIAEQNAAEVILLREGVWQSEPGKTQS
ncbi:ribonuclease III [Aureimonas ureilytica]|uniref:Ribonuclease 3 n=1 Tax=Aureimonas ureilytica TaxID=401562 RepID=A0A175RS31_9HYPH|nr:ribonuclease III [Aureimonas ureilytica]KTR06158.1 ribonuclease III [Aureimonas ureilytica]